MKKQTQFGSIEFEELNVADKMILLGELGYSFSKIEKMMSEESEEGSPEQLVFIGKLIKKFDDYVTSVDLKIKDKKISSYSEAIKSQEFINEVLPLITKELLNDDEDAEKK